MIRGGYYHVLRRGGEMSAVAHTDKLDLRTTLWERRARMNAPRAAHAMVAAGRNLFVFGARDSKRNIGEIFESNVFHIAYLAPYQYSASGLDFQAGVGIVVQLFCAKFTSSFIGSSTTPSYPATPGRHSPIFPSMKNSYKF
ncbi:hypothetical protein JTE90_003211 [Oedothorax gibbosus]|uniref:Uncharacterized protein n=1 Tax=Oedothorax gibbosus TaxID=931172 RepID=A0AAV6TND2_9ARAC|nr:hypothetical protein JTE90_003211 [Oedothorax gibbosus]